MEVENLMKPRYKVIADYPGSEQIGALGYVFNNCTNEQCAFMSKYPHLFKPLAWWEERKIADMPEYVKIKEDARGLYHLETFGQIWKAGTVMKVIRWFGTSPFLTKTEFVLACYVEPATESDYNNSPSATISKQ